MLTVKDLMKRYKVTRHTIAAWHARRILPQAMKIGALYRWREDDIEAFEEYLRELRNCAADGRDPYAAAGPAPPVYSNGREAFDPRACAARIAERERQERSKTLRASSEPIPTEAPINLPTAAVSEPQPAKSEE